MASKKGMMYPPVPDMLKSVQGRYLLVNVIARRARQIAIEERDFEETSDNKDEKPVSQAIDEIADGDIVVNMKQEYIQ